MAYYKAVEGFEFHNKIQDGNFTYYLYHNKGGQTLIKQIDDNTDATRFCLTTDAFATVLLNPTLYTFKILSSWTL